MDGMVSEAEGIVIAEPRVALSMSFLMPASIALLSVPEAPRIGQDCRAIQVGAMHTEGLCVCFRNRDLDRKRAMNSRAGVMYDDSMKWCVWLAIPSMVGCIFNSYGTEDESATDSTGGVSSTSGNMGPSSSAIGGANMGGGGATTSGGGLGGEGTTSSGTTTSAMSSSSTGPNNCGNGTIEYVEGEECDAGANVTMFCNTSCQLVCPAQIGDYRLARSISAVPAVCYVIKAMGSGTQSTGYDDPNQTNLIERCDDFAPDLGVSFQYVDPATPELLADVNLIGGMLGNSSGWLGGRRGGGTTWFWDPNPGNSAWTYVDGVAPWAAGEPNNLSEQCLMIRGDDKLNDAQCSANLTAVCEVRPPGE
jgi:hypothetical protein